MMLAHILLLLDSGALPVRCRRVSSERHVRAPCFRSCMLRCERTCLPVPLAQVVYIACTCGGFAFGAFWSLVPTLCTELFPPRHLASIYNIFSLAVTAASLLIATFAASTIYDAHVMPAPPAPPLLPTPPVIPTQQHASPPPPPPAPQCFGNGCYHDTHLLVVALCAAGIVAMEALSWRTRALYRAKLMGEVAMPAPAPMEPTTSA